MKILTAAVAVLTLALTSHSRAQALAADYQLQNTYASSVGGIGPLTPVGGGTVSFVTDTVDGNTQQVLTFQAQSTGPGADAGVRTQTNPFISSSNYSIVLLANFNLDQNFVVATKIFDFKNLSGDAGLYVQSSSGTLAFIDNTGVIQGTPGGAALSSLAYAQIVMTRDGVTNVVSVYQDGALAFSFVDSTGLAVLGDATPSGNSFLTLYKDDGMGLGGSLLNEGTQGNMARLRLYDGVLSASEVANLDRAIPEPATWALAGAGALLLAIITRRRAAARS